MTSAPHTHPRVFRAAEVMPYYYVFGALAVLTLLTVAASYVHLGRAGNIGVGLLIAMVKAGLVAAIFMHLRFEPRTVLFVFVCTLPLFVWMLFFLFWDGQALRPVWTEAARAAVAASAPPH